MGDAGPALFAASRSRIDTELARHPDLNSVSKATAHIIPEVRLVMGLVNGQTGRWLSQEIDLV